MSESVHKYALGLIGNCSYLAYIDAAASVQWLCMPRFDSSFVFGSLLDRQKGGEFSVSPVGKSYSSRQYYLKNTNILCTEFVTEGGQIRVTDFAPRFYHFERYFKPLMLIRKIEAVSGEPIVKVACSPRGGYGEIVPQTVTGSNHIRFLNLESQVRLTTDIPLSYVLQEKPFALSDARYCVFTYGEPLEAPLASTAEDFLQKTGHYWNQWVKATSIPPLYQEEVIRSALVLKLHQYEDTGGIIAAGTTSLPESDQSGNTWDYRYCWIRDSFYTLNAFNNIGHFEELEKYFDFIRNIVLNESESIQPVYGIGGERLLYEKEIALSGYGGNQPVRVGNDAYLQRQNDVYGQLIACLSPLYTDKRLDIERHRRQYPMIGWLLDRMEKTMELPDAGMWEFRGNQQYHCSSFFFHWVGCQAAIKIAKAMNDESLATRARNIAKTSREKIERCYDADAGGYVQAIGADALDASAFHLITAGYLDPASPRAARHLAALEKRLKTPSGLIFRYSNTEESAARRTSFLICSFWYAEALACMNRIDEAADVLDRTLRTANHLKLLSEDADEDDGQWGNFPQTYSHVGLINAVYRIAGKLENPNFY